ncbi:MAG: hypothetical protein ACRD3I_13225, partial [Terriglobales bacterium]
AMTLLNPNSDNYRQHFAAQPLFASVRFGRWQEILDTKAPQEGLDYYAGAWHYARGRAFVGTGNLDSAETELAALKKIAGKDEAKKGANANNVLNVAEEVLAGEIEARLGHTAEAVAHLEKGVELEDAMPYREPADWLYPVRHSLGAVLLAAGQAPKAEAVYREDLRRNPENGWALYGLMQALDTQRKKAESAEVKKRFDKAWAHADIALTASRI